MCISINLLLITGIMAPIAIFWSGPYLIVFSMTIFFTIFYCVLSFYSYGINYVQQKELIEAEKSAEEAQLHAGTETMVLNEADRLRIEKAIDEWIAKGGPLKPGLNIGHIVNETNVSRYQFTLWLRTTEWELFSPWLTHLRLEEAKRLLREHPDWSNDTIAESCGFCSRSYFQTVFKKLVGLTPAQYVANIKGVSD